MIPVDQALGLVEEHAVPLAAAEVRLADALGLLLAEDVKSDINSPPYTKSLMDGYAVQAHDPAEELEVIEEITAGEVPRHAVVPGTTIRVMTGAPVPEGANAVVMQERTARAGQQHVRISDPTLKPGQNILQVGASIKKGDVVLRRGTLIRPAEVGILAEVGRVDLLAVPRPRVAILATGNELVSHGTLPDPGKIRNSNGPMLAACVRSSCGVPENLGIIRDDRDVLPSRIEQGLAHDVLLLTGGVSVGVLDLVPKVLAHLGVREVFHKVQLKPGKPLWFGCREANGRRTLVFGLPGNPASSLVCFHVFVLPAMRALAGRGFVGMSRREAWLGSDFHNRGNRATFRPALLRETDGGATVDPIRWLGSADLAALHAANALIGFPPRDQHYVAGDAMAVYLLAELRS
jgi:molybdopterin molybdotransferase